ncbi:DUF4199 domain-containing protein [Patiriisocius hiemis]|uniref:DUF4199 domain-containing protein n=1 Tax=Patiriisocius hiemis TaxID=3075604 RepID=A0ABU2YFI7_9FLAO|nr:DUF4199 domain-containing protein [Constantimarinum sp. W242]MDT0556439.1 DUF4199 domain-containing protein [Constantimarinum sp. W242]
MNKVIIRYGVIISIVLIAYFLISKLIGLHQYPVFSAVNAVIFGFGILMAMKNFKSNQSEFKYQNGFQVGFFTGVFATIIFTAFMAVYVYMIDKEFSGAILDSYGLDYNKGSLIMLITLAIMGISTSLVLTLSFMQLLKESWNTNQKQ